MTKKELEYLERLKLRICHLKARGSQLRDKQEVTKELHALEWAVAALQATPPEEVMPELRHLQDAPRTVRNTFTIQHDGKRADVVFSSFAACIEREANSLRATLSPLVECLDCGGTGLTPIGTCLRCGGTGELPQREQKIP